MHLPSSPFVRRDSSLISTLWVLLCAVGLEVLYMAPIRVARAYRIGYINKDPDCLSRAKSSIVKLGDSFGRVLVAHSMTITVDASY